MSDVRFDDLDDLDTLCRTCGGSGVHVYDDGDREPCATCGGSGYVAPAGAGASFQDAQVAFARERGPSPSVAAEVRTEASKGREPSDESVRCERCHGSGVVVIGYVHVRQVPCRLCKGTGRHHPKRRERQAAFRKGLETKARREQERRTRFRADYPDVVAYLARRTENPERCSPFVWSLNEQLAERGELSVRQIEAVRAGIARDAERAEQRRIERDAERPATAVDAAGVDQLTRSLAAARAAGIQYGRLRVGDLVFSLAREGSRNAGAVYVKRGEEYLGLVSNGAFRPRREGEAYAARVAEVLTDPLAAARAHGLRTGHCSCCGRELTDPLSIARGVGPTCEAKYFPWAEERTDEQREVHRQEGRVELASVTGTVARTRASDDEERRRRRRERRAERKRRALQQTRSVQS